jgi:hypothetical protein
VSTQTPGDDLPEIRVEAYDKIDRWRVKLDKTEKLKKRDVFERAALDLFLEAECERDLRAVQAITDAIYILRRDYTGLNDDDIQYVMVGAKTKAECRPTNSDHLNNFPLPQIDAAADVPPVGTNKTTNTVGQNRARLKSARAATYQIAAVKWLWPSRFAIGKLGILAGLPDEGKGQVLADIAARTTRASEWPVARALHRSAT